MEQFVGFLIFVMLAIFSVASKVREQRKEEERRAQKARGKQEEQIDLPEATRRTLYGKPGIPTAKPREAPPPVAFPMREVREQPDSARPVEVERPNARHAPAERQRRIPAEAAHGPGQTRAPAPPPQAGRKPSSLEDLFREMQRRVEEQMGIPQSQPQSPPQAPPRPPLRPRPQQQQQQQQQHSTASYEQARKQQQAERAKAMQRQHAPRPEAPQHTQRGGPARGKPAPTAAAPAARPQKQRQRRPAAATLFRDIDDVRRGIIMSEVLGTPRSLQFWP